MQDVVTRIRLFSLDTLADVLVKAILIVKLSLCEHDSHVLNKKIVMVDLSTGNLALQPLKKAYLHDRHSHRTWQVVRLPPIK